MDHFISQNNNIDYEYASGACELQHMALILKAYWGKWGSHSLVLWSVFGSFLGHRTYLWSVIIWPSFRQSESTII